MLASQRPFPALDEAHAQQVIRYGSGAASRPDGQEGETSIHPGFDQGAQWIQPCSATGNPPEPLLPHAPLRRDCPVCQ